MNRISLRTRLVAVAVTLVAVAVVATGIATYAALSGFLHSRLDDQVLDAAQRHLPLCLVQDDFGGGFDFYAQPLTPTGLPAQCTSGTQAGNPLDLDPSTIGEVLAGPGQLHSIRAVDGTPYRAILARRREGLVVVALPTGRSTAR